MTKKDFVAQLAERTGSTKKAAGENLDSVLELIVDTLSAGEDVRFVGFGNFVTKYSEGRVGHNPKTGDKIDIPGKTVSRFKAGKVLKEAVVTLPKQEA